MKTPGTIKAKFKVKLFTLAMALAGLFIEIPVQAQVNVSVNISSQMLWGPVGYDYVEYYYLPEWDVFYYLPSHQFIYWSGGQYLFVSSLPFRINFYSTYVVVVNEPKPYLRHNVYVMRYAKYKHSGPKYQFIRDSKDPRYYVVRGHPSYNGNGSGSRNANYKQTNNRSQQEKIYKDQPQRQPQQQPQFQPRYQKAPGHGGGRGKGH